ncbi:hypothetical protein D3C83_303430 [compost metagenome]
MPIFMRDVRAAMALAIASGADATDRVGLMCSSASHMQSSPHLSAASTCSNDSAKARSSL